MKSQSPFEDSPFPHWGRFNGYRTYRLVPIPFRGLEASLLDKSIGTALAFVGRNPLSRIRGLATVEMNGRMKGNLANVAIPFRGLEASLHVSLALPADRRTGVAIPFRGFEASLPSLRLLKVFSENPGLRS